MVRGTAVLLGPDLLGRPVVHEAHGHARVAVTLQELPAEREARPPAGGGRELAQLLLQDHAHVPVAVELHRQVVDEQSGRLVAPFLRPAPGTQAEHDRGPAAPVLQGLRSVRSGLRRIGSSRPSQQRDVAASRQLEADRVAGSPEEVVTLNATAGARRFPSRACRAFSSGHVATTSIVAPTTAARNGRRTQSDAAIRSKRLITARVVRVRSWRMELGGDLSGEVVGAGGERVMVKGGLLPR